VIINLAAICLGSIDIPVYPTLTHQQLQFIFQDSAISTVIVSNTLQLKKVLKIRGSIPLLHTIIVMSEKEKEDQQDVIPFSSAIALLQHERVRAMYSEEIDLIQKNLPNFERVRRFDFLPAPLSVESGEMIPTQTVKRKVVEQKYAHLIEKMYPDIPKR
jgi:long-chain acyl-CoA synthetase